MKRQVGLVGAGSMGLGMAKNLLKASFPLTVYDVRRKPLEELAILKAKIAKSSKEVGKLSDVVILMLLTGAQLEDATLGKDGVLSGMKKGGTIISMGTVNLLVTRRIAESASKRGISMVDAPVSGGTDGAAAGTLTIMASGEKAVVDGCHEIFAAIGKTVLYLGNVGMGQVAKIANQVVACAEIAAMAEALVLAAKAGADPEAVYNVINNGTAGSPALKYFGSNLIKRRFKNTGAPIKILLKDIELAMDLGKEYKAPMFLGAVLTELYKTAVAVGSGEDDMSSVARVWERLADIQVRSSCQTNAD